MNQIPNIEETELIKLIADIVWEATDGGVKMTPSQFSHFEEPIGALTDFQNYLHQQLQKARQDWLREEIVRLSGLKFVPRIGRNKEGKIVDYTSPIEEGHNNALQTIIDHHQKELDQPINSIIKE